MNIWQPVDIFLFQKNEQIKCDKINDLSDISWDISFHNIFAPTFIAWKSSDALGVLIRHESWANDVQIKWINLCLQSSVIHTDVHLLQTKGTLWRETRKRWCRHSGLHTLRSALRGDKRLIETERVENVARSEVEGTRHHMEKVDLRDREIDVTKMPKWMFGEQVMNTWSGGSLARNKFRLRAFVTATNLQTPWQES